MEELKAVLGFLFQSISQKDMEIIQLKQQIDALQKARSEDVKHAQPSI